MRADMNILVVGNEAAILCGVTHSTYLMGPGSTHAQTHTHTLGLVQAPLCSQSQHVYFMVTLACVSADRHTDRLC